MCPGYLAELIKRAILDPHFLLLYYNLQGKKDKEIWHFLLPQEVSSLTSDAVGKVIQILQIWLKEAIVW